MTSFHPGSDADRRGPRPRTRAAAAALAALSLLVAAPGALAGVETTVVDGVPHVTNGAEPRDGTHELQLEEVWRRGGLDDEEVLLGIITAVQSGPEGNIYVLDSQLMEVQVFSPNGEYLQTLGRQGEGPGEFTNANAMVFLPDGTLGVVQGMPGKIVALNLDGTPAGTVTLGSDPAQGGFAVVQQAACDGGNLVVAGIEFRMPPGADQFTREATQFLRSYGMDGSIRHEFYSETDTHVFGEGYVLDELRWDSPARRYGVGPAGQVLIAPEREEYRFHVYDENGELRRVFGRQYQSLPRSEAMLSRFDRMLELQARQMSPDGRRKVADNEQDVWDIRCQPDGSYWVLSSRGLFAPPSGTLAAWDVFSAEGEYLRRVTADIPGDPGEDLLFLTGDGHAVQVTGFWEAVLSAMGAGSDDPDAEPMEIICYAIHD